MPSQIDLFRDDWRTAGRRLLDHMRAAVDQIGHKQVALEVGVSESFLSQCLSGTNRAHFRAEWVPWLIAHAPSDESLKFLASLRGRDVVEKRPPSPEEQLANLKAALRVHLSDLHLEDVYQTARAIHRQGDADVISIARELHSSRRPPRRYPHTPRQKTATQ